MSVQYSTVVDWDTTLIDVEFTDTDTAPTAMQGLVQFAIKTTSGVPTATVGKFARGAIVQNAATGIVYIMNGTTASPTFTPIDTAAGLALTNAHIFVGNASNLPADVALSGDATISNAGALTIANLAVTAAKLASDAVTTAKILDANVTTAKLADNSVTGAKIALASQVGGDIMYYDGTDWVRLAKGTAGQVLTMNAGATAPEWQTP